MSRLNEFDLTSPLVKLVENDVEKQCLDVLRRLGFYMVRLHAGRFKTADGKRWITGVDKGTPDWAAIKGAGSFLLEVKRPGGKLSLKQAWKIQEMRQVYPDLPVVVVKSIEELVGWLKRYQAP